MSSGTKDHTIEQVQGVSTKSKVFFVLLRVCTTTYCAPPASRRRVELRCRVRLKLPATIVYDVKTPTSQMKNAFEKLSTLKKLKSPGAVSPKDHIKGSEAETTSPEAKAKQWKTESADDADAGDAGDGGAPDAGATGTDNGSGGGGAHPPPDGGDGGGSTGAATGDNTNVETNEQTQQTKKNKKANRGGIVGCFFALLGPIFSKICDCGGLFARTGWSFLCEILAV